jgi:hypothetical protein
MAYIIVHHQAADGKSLLVEILPRMTTASYGTIMSDSVTSDAARLEAASSTGYQRCLDGVAISGATNSMPVLQDLNAADAGNYCCLVSNASGSTLTSAAALKVISTNNPGRLVNISCRVQVGTSGTS